MSKDRVQNEQNDQSEINLGDLFLIAKKYIVLLIAVTLVAAVLVYAFTALFIKPTYSASSKIYIVASSGVLQISDLTISSNVAQDYIDLINDKVVLQAVIDDMNLPYTVSQLRSMVSATNTSGTHMLVITVKGHDSKEVADIANCIADMTINTVPDKMQVHAPTLISGAEENKSKIAPSNTRNALIGGLIALALTYGILFLRYFLDDSIRSAADVERYGNLHILGEISDLRETSKAYGKYGHYGRYGHYGQYGHYGEIKKESGDSSSHQGKGA